MKRKEQTISINIIDIAFNYCSEKFKNEKYQSWQFLSFSRFLTFKIWNLRKWSTKMDKSYIKKRSSENYPLPPNSISTNEIKVNLHTMLFYQSQRKGSTQPGDCKLFVFFIPFSKEGGNNGEWNSQGYSKEIQCRRISLQT